MLHCDRVWCVASVASAEELAKKVTEMTWCCCTGFRLEGYVFVNDSTSPDGIQEYAVLKEIGDRRFQIESLTFGWCDEQDALNHVQRTLAGEYDLSEFLHEVSPTLQTPEDHGRCPHCA